MRQVKAKLGKMRKEQEFSVYPAQQDGQIIVQSDKAIGAFDPETRKGVLNAKGSNSKYFAHLNPMLGAEEYEFPVEFVEACKAAQPRKGSMIGGVLEIG